MIRNHFYLDYKTPQEAIDNLHDLVGITVECRFIRNEHELYRSLFSYFERQKTGYAVCKVNENLFWIFLSRSRSCREMDSRFIA